MKALEVFIGERAVGHLFQYPVSPEHTTNRFVAHDAFADDSNQELLSVGFLAADAQAQAAFWRGVSSPVLNGSLSRDPQRGWLLPAWFQGLLPEGPLRNQIAELRGCGINDHFELLAATGADLPGNVYVRPADLDHAQMQRLVTSNHDALEMSVTAEPIQDAISVSGIQAKLSVLKLGDRFVARTRLDERDQARHVIAKLPVVGQPLLPELEELSLRLAAAAGVNTVQAELAPLGRLEAQHHYDLGDANASSQFLAVQRYDRDADTPTRRVHCEDFAQILGVQPEAKYTRDYLSVARVLMALPTLGEPAVHELLRRILVSEMLGNADMHLKNMGLRYPDGRTPELPPAYDIVGYAAYAGMPRGRALHLSPDQPEGLNRDAVLTVRLVRGFCTQLGIVEKPVLTALRRCRDAAYALWPAMIEAAGLTERMKAGLLRQLQWHRDAQASGQRTAPRPPKA